MTHYIIHIAELIGAGLLAYFCMGFLVASFLTKFEVPTSWDNATRNKKWVSNASDFTLIWTLWPLMTVVCSIEQVVWRIVNTKSFVEKYIVWLRRENSNKRIEA